MFLTNTWYVACSSDEIDNKPLGRTVCNHRVVFYRPQPDPEKRKIHLLGA